MVEPKQLLSEASGEDWGNEWDEWEDEPAA